MKPSSILVLALVGVSTSAQINGQYVKRQLLDLSLDLLGTGTASSSSTTPVSSTSSAAPTTTPPVSTTSSDPPTTSTPPSTTSESSTPTSTPPASSSTPSSTSSSVVSTTSAKTTLPVTTKAMSTITEIVVESGTTKTSLSTSSGAVTPTSLSDSSDSTSSGMSSKTKTTIIGVAAGVGGAVLLGAIILIARRVFANRRNKMPEDDGLMEYNGYNGGMSSGLGSAREKDSIVTGSGHAAGSGHGPANPFQSTLESYHNPAQARNVSSNF